MANKPESSEQNKPAKPRQPESTPKRREEHGSFSEDSRNKGSVVTNTLPPPPPPKRK